MHDTCDHAYGICSVGTEAEYESAKTLARQRAEALAAFDADFLN